MRNSIYPLIVMLFAIIQTLNGQEIHEVNKQDENSLKISNNYIIDTKLLDVIYLQRQIINNMMDMMGILNDNITNADKRMDSIYFALNIEVDIIQSTQMKQLEIEELRSADTYFSIKKAMQRPLSVYKLDLSKNALTEFPIEIKQFTNLQKLVLSDNLIEEIPDWIVQLGALQYIYVDNNRFEKIPKALIEINSLILIDLSCNPIRYSTFGIKRGANLEVLNLHDTRINYKELQRLENSLGGIVVR